MCHNSRDRYIEVHFQTGSTLSTNPKTSSEADLLCIVCFCFEITCFNICHIRCCLPSLGLTFFDSFNDSLRTSRPHRLYTPFQMNMAQTILPALPTVYLSLLKVLGPEAATGLGEYSVR